jgi:Mrp family chromosome partitioning ATPase
VDIGGMNTRVLVEQSAALAPAQLGKSVGFLSIDEMRPSTRHCASSSNFERATVTSDENPLWSSAKGRRLQG